MADKRISQLVDRGTVANNDVVPIVVSGATTTNKATISSIQTFMQGNLDLGVTSVGITLGSSGTDVSVSGSPITSSGNITINLPTASATNRGLLSAADWVTFNSKQDAGSFVTLDTTQTITAQKTFTTSGGSDTIIIDHTSGSGIALDISKAGNGEGIRVNKTSGSGNAMTISGGNFEAGTIVKTGGTSSQFLKADGSVDSSSYALNSSLSLYLPLTGGTISGQLNVGSGNLRIAAEGASNITILRNFTGTAQGQSGFNNIGFNNSNNFYFTKNLNNGAIFAFSNTAYQTYTLPDASGTLAFTSDISSAVAGYLPLTLTSTQRIVELNGQFLEVYSSANSFTSGRLIVAPTYGAIGYQTNGIFRGLQILTDGTAVLTNTGTLTMTGALNGTSASFTGAVTSDDLILTAGTLFGAGNTGFSNRLSDTTLYLQMPATGFNITDNALNTRFSLASTGAATFSSSVTAGGSGNVILGVDASYPTYNTIGFGGTLANGQNRIFAGNSSTNDGVYLQSKQGINFWVNGTSEVATVTSNSYFRMLAGSGGIQFNGDTAAANALDDYEEGTWTPTTNGDATGAFSTAYGEYTKIGNFVFFRAVVSIETNFTSSSIAGLPFTVGGNASASSLYGGTIIFNSVNSGLSCSPSIGSTIISIYSGSATSSNTAPTTSMATLRISGSYRV